MTPNKLALLNLPLAGVYYPLIMLVMATDSIGMDTSFTGKIKDAGMLTVAFGGMTAYAFPVIASGLTILTQNPSWLLLDFVPLATIGTGFVIMTAIEKVK